MFVMVNLTRAADAEPVSGPSQVMVKVTNGSNAAMLALFGDDLWTLDDDRQVFQAILSLLLDRPPSLALANPSPAVQTM